MRAQTTIMGADLSSPTVPHSSLLMRELDRLARDANWSNTDLAARLGVDPTMLMHLRAGRNLFSSQLLGRILNLFPMPAVDDLVLHHLRVERRTRESAKLAVPSDDRLAGALDAAARKTLRTFVRDFARTSVETARGLYVVGDDARQLSLAAQFVAEGLGAQGIGVERLTANTKLTASTGRAALAAALLLVERAEFLSASVADLLLRRSDVVKPIVVTSTRPVTDVADTHLQRTFKAMLRLVLLSAPVAAEPSSSPNAHVG
jgi:hypothetical protein